MHDDAYSIVASRGEEVQLPNSKHVAFFVAATNILWINGNAYGEDDGDALLPTTRQPTTTAFLIIAIVKFLRFRMTTTTMTSFVHQFYPKPTAKQESTPRAKYVRLKSCVAERCFQTIF